LAAGSWVGGERRDGGVLTTATMGPEVARDVMSLRRRSWQLWWWLVRFHDSPWCNTEGARG
jgi:hypothetical protein